MKVSKGRTELEELSCESSPSNKIVSIGKSIGVFNQVTNESLLRDKLFGSFQFPGKISLGLRKRTNSYFTVPYTDTGG